MRVYVLNLFGVSFQMASNTGARITYWFALLVFYKDKMFLIFETESMHMCKCLLEWPDVYRTDRISIRSKHFSGESYEAKYT